MPPCFLSLSWRWEGSFLLGALIERLFGFQTSSLGWGVQKPQPPVVVCWSLSPPLLLPDAGYRSYPAVAEGRAEGGSQSTEEDYG